ncbi:MAG: VWA domain-containing protein [Bacteroidetes bacterium]|nr:VWA domain-containing protein [Bacteroidota bacterium]
MLDNSGSISGVDFDSLKAGALSVVRMLGIGDEAAIYHFSNGGERVIDFTGDVPSLETAIGNLALGANTPIYHTMTLALQDLAAHPAALLREIGGEMLTPNCVITWETNCTDSLRAMHVTAQYRGEVAEADTLFVSPWRPDQLQLRVSGPARVRSCAYPVLRVSGPARIRSCACAGNSSADSHRSCAARCATTAACSFSSMSFRVTWGGISARSRSANLSGVIFRCCKNDQDAFALKLEPGQGMVFELRVPEALEIEEFEP